ESIRPVFISMRLISESMRLNYDSMRLLKILNKNQEKVLLSIKNETPIYSNLNFRQKFLFLCFTSQKRRAPNSGLFSFFIVFTKNEDMKIGTNRTLVRFALFLCVCVDGLCV